MRCIWRPRVEIASPDLAVAFATFDRTLARAAAAEGLATPFRAGA